MAKLKSDCIFCKIVKKELNSEIVKEDEKTLAFKDINPQAPFHVVVVPKTHIEKLSDLEEKNVSCISNMFLTANSIAKELGIDETGYRLVMNSGEYGGQTVYHIHLHLLGGRKMDWPPG